MKAISLKGEFKTFPIKKVLKEVLETVPPPTAQKPGISPGEMAFRLKIIRFLEEAEEELLLEDVDHAQLDAIVQHFPFGVVSQDIVDIAEAVKNAESVEAQRKKG